MASTGIHFDDDAIRPTRTLSRDHTATGTDTDRGIVFSRTITPDQRSHIRSLSRGLRRSSRSNLEDDPETAGLPTDHRVKQTFKGKQLLYLAYQSIGVIYGDIGTSPLYVFSSTFSGPPVREDVIGILSLVIWSLLMMVTLKYVVIVLHADNEGEGGTFSCYSLLSRYARIANIDPKERTIRIQRMKTGEMPGGNHKIRTFIEKSKVARGLLKIIGVFAVSMVMSDGVLTPAQSILGAYQGLNVATTVTSSTVVGATCGTLVVLFLLQPFGTTKLASTFAPIVIIWLGLTGGMGIYNLIMHDYAVLKAFNPAEGFMFLIRHKEEGWHRLGGVLLAFTGVEALFADLGAFSMRAIQISWLGWCLPMLLLTYAGQAAYISRFPDAYAYPVYSTAPPGMLIPSIIFAVLAAIVASQAIITATFQLIAQITKLSYFPAIKVIHTSKVYHNQLYVPIANWLLMIGTIIVTAVYNNTTSLGNAYGVCVIFVTFFDTIMVTLVALIVWLKPWYLVILPALTILCMDGAFLSSALLKVPDGAWFTIALASVLASVFILWRFGKEQQWHAEAEDRLPTSQFIKQDTDGEYRLVQYGHEVLATNKGFGIFFDKIGDKTPVVFSQFIGKLATKTDVIVFLHMRAVETPTVEPDERYFVQELNLPNCYRLVVRHGYMDAIVTADLASIIFKELREYIIRRHADRNGGARDGHTILSPQLSEKLDRDAIDKPRPDQTISSQKHSFATDSPSTHEGETLPSDLAYIENAYDHRVLYVIGKEEMKIRTDSPFWRKVLLSAFLFVRHNSRSKMANLKVPTERLVEIGFLKEI
ncbi:hypothetical protein B0A48_13424 [Cryoendolithus antarcticus]|uniref:Potassium uptake protein n=1 Tax=Cryoendolithus antarcticus TaxID=1507870 RepID=A0A1V8SQB7_9PEZI|nr:hypothetical protein B0A48_13424 [Cryoendolithus antarcticus]